MSLQPTLEESKRALELLTAQHEIEKINHQIENKKNEMEKEKFEMEKEKFEMEKEREIQLVKNEVYPHFPPFIIDYIEKERTCSDAYWLKFREESGKSVIGLIEDRFGQSNPDIVAKLKQIYSTEIGQLPDSVFAINNLNNRFISVEAKTLDEFFPFQFIYVRKCFQDLREPVIEAAKDGSVIIMGDPGIGKSTFLRYTYCTSSSSQKIFWAMESGFWVYKNGNSIFCGDSVNKIWMERDVLLLIDGTYNDKFLCKRKNVILFCSPEKSNFHKLFKATNPPIFIMPPWSEEEVLCLFNFQPPRPQSQLSPTECLGVSLMKPLFYSILRCKQRLDAAAAAAASGTQTSAEPVTSNPDVEMYYETATSEEEEESNSESVSSLVTTSITSDSDSIATSPATNTPPSSASTISTTITAASSTVSTYTDPTFLEYSEIASMRKIARPEEYDEIRKFLLENVLMRFKLIGGRIRQLMNPKVSFMHLNDAVVKAVSSLSILSVANFTAFEVEQSNVPSVVYSLHPSPVDIMFPYSTAFASDYIKDLAINHFLGFQKSMLKDIFEYLKSGHLLAAPIYGQLFERSVHKYLLSGQDINLRLRSLGANQTELSLTFGASIKSGMYSSRSENLTQFYDNLSAGEVLYLRPTTLNAPQVDSVAIRMGETADSRRTIDFYQITTAKTHIIDRIHVENLARSFRVGLHQIRYIYLVPRNMYDGYQRQEYCPTANGSEARIFPRMNQFVASIPEDVFSIEYL